MVAGQRGYFISNHRWLTFAGRSVRRGWVGGDDRPKRQGKRLRDKKVMGSRDFRAPRQEGRS